MTKLNRALIRVAMASAGWLCGFAGVQGVGEVSAEPIRQFSVEYTSAPGCPSREQLVQGVEGRTALARHVPGSRAVRVALRISKQDAADEYTAQLSIEGEVDSPPREFSGATCDEVTAAAALIIALAIDPEATQEPRALVSGSAVTEGLDSSTAPSPTPVGRGDQATEGPAPVVGCLAGVGLTGGVGDGVAPLLSLGAEVRAALTPTWSAGATIQALYARGNADGVLGSADFGLLGLRLGLAPYVIASDEWLFTPSLSFDFGRLEATARDVPNAGSDAAPWVGPGLELSLGRRLLNVAGGVLAVGVRGGAVWSLARDYFYFREASGKELRVFEQPALVAHGSLNLELAW